MCGKEYESRTGLNYHNSGTHHDLIAQKAKAGAAHKEVAADSNTSRPLVRSPQPSSPLSPTVKKRGRRGRPRKTQVTFGAGHGSDPASTPPPSSEGSPPPDKSNLPLKKVTITIPSIEYPVSQTQSRVGICILYHTLYLGYTPTTRCITDLNYVSSLLGSG